MLKNEKIEQTKRETMQVFLNLHKDGFIEETSLIDVLSLVNNQKELLSDYAFNNESVNSVFSTIAHEVMGDYFVEYAYQLGQEFFETMRGQVTYKNFYLVPASEHFFQKVGSEYVILFRAVMPEDEHYYKLHIPLSDFHTCDVTSLLRESILDTLKIALFDLFYE